ncbi:MAG: hypothetical protein H7842_02165 [Gammaproteobacteria bacterium SHHR-1]|uniref:hypothetical protein n=1 Tax=Magnetovirga frankeli TaxID=947516 RepID=UPI00129354F0|nr:hypothetical protein D5125_02445 [gamma proteobacterium SS-5]
MKAIKIPSWLLSSALVLPVGTVLAQDGYSFRPMPGQDSAASQVPPGWRLSPLPARQTGAQPADDHMGYRFAPRQAEAAGAEQAAAPTDGDPNALRYKPKEAAALQPPPLPTAIDPSHDPAMQGYGMGQAMGQGQAYEQSAQGGFSLPERPAMPEPPPRPDFNRQRLNRPEPPTRPEPPPRPKPLYLEGRYIDGMNRHQHQSYPFRPLEDEKEETARAGSPEGNNRTQSRGAPTYAYPPQPPLPPAYPPMPYDSGYNNNRGPSFNGFRVPFGNGNFPFNFR